MQVRFAIVLGLVLAALTPAVAAARTPAATLTTPTVSWVRVVDVPTGRSAAAGRVVVRIRIQHHATGAPAPDVVLTGSVTAVLSRYRNGRDYAIAAQTASRVLPVRAAPTGVVYQLVLSPAHSRAVRSAAAAGALRTLVSVDQRANAKGRTPVSRGTFVAGSASVQRLTGSVPLDPAPLYRAARGQSVVVEATRRGTPQLVALTLAVGGGRTLEIVGPVGIGEDGRAALNGRPARLAAADGTVLATGAAPAGAELQIGGNLRERARVSWPEWILGEEATLAAGEAALTAPTPKRPRR